MKLAWLLGCVAGKYVTEYDLDGVNYSTEARNIGLSRFMVNGRASVGFKKVHLFAEAALLPLFEKTVTAPVSYSTCVRHRCVWVLGLIKSKNKERGHEAPFRLFE